MQGLLALQQVRDPEGEHAMRASPFPEANLVLQPPSPEDLAAGTVVPLPVCRYRDLDGNLNVLSRWELTEEDLARILETRCVWFNCWGSTHPPVSLFTEDPFRKATT